MWLHVHLRSESYFINVDVWDCQCATQWQWHLTFISQSLSRQKRGRCFEYTPHLPVWKSRWLMESAECLREQGECVSKYNSYFVSLNATKNDIYCSKKPRWCLRGLCAPRDALYLYTFGQQRRDPSSSSRGHISLCEEVDHVSHPSVHLLDKSHIFNIETAGNWFWNKGASVVSMSLAVSLSLWWSFWHQISSTILAAETRSHDLRWTLRHWWTLEWSLCQTPACSGTKPNLWVCLGFTFTNPSLVTLELHEQMAPTWKAHVHVSRSQQRAAVRAVTLT